MLLANSLSMASIPSDESLACPIVDLKHVFSCLRQENDLSAKQEVAGREAKILTCSLKLGIRLLKVILTLEIELFCTKSSIQMSFQYCEKSLLMMKKNLKHRNKHQSSHYYILR